MAAPHSAKHAASSGAREVSSFTAGVPSISIEMEASASSDVPSISMEMEESASSDGSGVSAGRHTLCSCPGGQQKEYSRCKTCKLQPAAGSGRETGLHERPPILMNIVPPCFAGGFFYDRRKAASPPTAVQGVREGWLLSAEATCGVIHRFCARQIRRAAAWICRYP